MAESFACGIVEPFETGERPTEEGVERAVAFAIEPFLRSQIIDGNWTDQAFSEVSRECARIAIATINNGPATPSVAREDGDASK